MNPREPLSCQNNGNTLPESLICSLEGLFFAYFLVLMKYRGLRNWKFVRYYVAGHKRHKKHTYTLDTIPAAVPQAHRGEQRKNRRLSTRSGAGEIGGN